MDAAILLILFTFAQLKQFPKLVDLFVKHVCVWP